MMWVCFIGKTFKLENATLTYFFLGGKRLDILFFFMYVLNYIMKSNINKRQTAETDEGFKSGKLAMPLRNKS